MCRDAAQAEMHGVGCAVPAAREGRVGAQRLAERVGEEPAMVGDLGGAGERRRALHHLGVTHRPFVGLLRAHRAAEDERELGDAEFFRQQLVLRAHVVRDAQGREAGTVSDGAGVFDGDEESPSPIWSTMTTKYFSGSSARPGPT